MWTSAPGRTFSPSPAHREPSNASVPDCSSGPTYDSKLSRGSLYPLYYDSQTVGLEIVSRDATRSERGDPRHHSHLLSRRRREARVIELYQPCSRTSRSIATYRVLARLRVKLVFGLRAPMTTTTSVPAACYTGLAGFIGPGCATRIRN
jgi:hypothetical protein